MKILFFVVLMTGQFVRSCESYNSMLIPLSAAELQLDDKAPIEIIPDTQESDEISNRAHTSVLFSFDPEQSIEDNTQRYHENFLLKRNRLTFVCCEKAFAWKLFCKHVAHKHSSPENLINCPLKECKKTFSTIGHAYLHIALHQYPDLLACPVCNEKLSAVSAAKKHVMRCWQKKSALGTYKAPCNDEPSYEGVYEQLSHHEDVSYQHIANNIHQQVYRHTFEFYPYHH